MTENVSTQILWRGRQTAAQVAGMIENTEKIVIQFPVNFNHALFRALNKQAPESAVERLDNLGGPELLDDAVTVRGLEDLAELIMPLRNANARLHFLSPPSLTIIFER